MSPTLRGLVDAEFPRDSARGYLDSATYGLPPQRTLEAFEVALGQWRDRAPLTVWEEDGERCRELFAELAGVPAHGVALLPAVSVAAGLVAATLEPSAGANIVVHEGEFASNLLPWHAAAERGIELRSRPLEALASAVDDHTLLLAVSAVQFSDGALVDLEPLKALPAALFVDATQAVGALPVDFSGIDYVVAAAYKWLLGPRGLCFLSVAPERLAGVKPWFAGWKSRKDPYDASVHTGTVLADDARRLDVSLPWLVASGLRSSLELVAEVGVERLGEHNLGLARAFCAGADLPAPAAPIVKAELAKPQEVARQLRERGINCAAHSDGVRLAFHLYNDEADVHAALDALAPFAERRR